MGARLEIPPFLPEIRWLIPYINLSVNNTSVTATAGRVWLNEFEVIKPCIVDAVNIYNQATVNGNVIVGIYGPIVTEEEAQGSPLVVESASTALSGASNAQTISLTQTTLAPGRYYVAVQYSSGTHTYGRQADINVVTGWSQYYDRGGGYGALTNPCPATTKSTAAIPNARLRCVV